MSPRLILEKYLPSTIHRLVTFGLVLIFSLVLILILWTPRLQVGWVEASQLLAISSPINALSNPLQLEFASPHRIEFSSGTNYTTTSHQVLSSDLQEGSNTITWQAIKNWGLIEWVSSPKQMTIYVDRVAPEAPTLEQEIPSYTQLQDKLRLPLSGEIGTTILNKEEVLGQLTQDDEIFLPLVDGLNTPLITLQDSAGNKSEPLELQIFSLVRPGWTIHRCEDLTFPINDKFQIGFSYEQKWEQNSIDNDYKKFIEKSQTGDCNYNQNGGGGTNIVFKGKGLGCWGCGGGADSYLQVVANSALLKDSLKENNITLQEPFSTLSGIDGTHYNLSYYVEFFDEFFYTDLYVIEYENNTYSFHANSIGQKVPAQKSADLRQLVDNVMIAR